MSFSVIPQEVHEYGVFAYVPIEQLQQLSNKSSEYYRMYWERLDDLVRNNGLLDFYINNHLLYQQQEGDYDEMSLSSDDMEIEEITKNFQGLGTSESSRPPKSLESVFASDNPYLLQDVLGKLVDLSKIPMYQSFLEHLAILTFDGHHPRILEYLISTYDDFVDIVAEKAFDDEIDNGELIWALRQNPKIFRLMIESGAAGDLIVHLLETDPELGYLVPDKDLYRLLIALHTPDVLFESFSRYLETSGILRELQEIRFVPNSALVDILAIGDDYLWDLIPENLHNVLKAYVLWLYLMNLIDYVPDIVLDDLVGTIVDLRYILGDNQPIGAYLETKNLIDDYLDTNPPDIQIRDIIAEYRQLNPQRAGRFIAIVEGR